MQTLIEISLIIFSCCTLIVTLCVLQMITIFVKEK